MAEDEDGVSNKKSAQNSNNGGSSQDNEQNRTDLPYFPRLLTPETEEAKCNNNENGDASPAEAKSSSSKSTGATRKEENPFSFRHFLKRDLSLPGNSTYENTGARPKVYASTVQHSPTREPRPHPRAKEKSADGGEPRARDNTSSSSSAEASFSVADDSESKHNLYTDNSDAQLYRAGPEPPGMPSLPDFVQDHILVEQAYLNSDGPISVDLDNLPDFTFNTNHNAGSSSSLGRRSAGGYGGRRSTSGEARARVPLDLPPGAAPAPDLQLSLDLTESVNQADRRNASPRNTFPLDLPPNAGTQSSKSHSVSPFETMDVMSRPKRRTKQGAESTRLPDFLPAHPGRASPEPEREDAAQRLLRELERTRCELAAERGRRERLERELAAARRHTRPRHAPGDDERRESPESDSTVGQLRAQIRRLEEELSASREEAAGLRARTRGAAADLRGAAAVAEGSLRDLLAGLEQLRGLGAKLDPA